MPINAVSQIGSPAHKAKPDFRLGGSKTEAQGHRLIHQAVFGEESLRLPCEAASGGREFDGSNQVMPIEGSILERSEVLRGVTSEDRFAVDAEPHQRLGLIGQPQTGDDSPLKYPIRLGPVQLNDQVEQGILLWSTPG